MRYDTVFLDVDGTLLWMDFDLAGYVRDLSPYSSNGLTVERARGPVREALRRHISENINYPTGDELAAFRRANAERTARSLGVCAPPEVLATVLERRISFNPYPESERVMEELRALGSKLYVVSNWDVELEGVLEDLGWRGYFETVVASAVVGVEKPGRGIFEEALRASGRAEDRWRVVHVGNDPISDIKGAAGCGLDAVLVDRKGTTEAPEAISTVPDLSLLPGLVKG